MPIRQEPETTKNEAGEINRRELPDPHGPAAEGGQLRPESAMNSMVDTDHPVPSGDFQNPFQIPNPLAVIDAAKGIPQSEVRGFLAAALSGLLIPSAFSFMTVSALLLAKAWYYTYGEFRNLINLKSTDIRIGRAAFLLLSGLSSFSYTVITIISAGFFSIISLFLALFGPGPATQVIAALAGVFSIIASMASTFVTDCLTLLINGLAMFI
eukprot:gnl/TRDRNA2_/TRDRNA2_28249_c0_seq1.p1 gnl/TRDRNA2_/TRDRNA2_28249_c0~~gnl/TRDRNA2_/TRDRNA2_28249_c0_seq1.p1  ORF type:complete len:211 (-),score=10.97 gnl/TRDRNA2_/TRDRNA2_28249_c0_seq1:147-779(-)